MKKPYMICHMIADVCGRTQTKHWPGVGGRVFEDTVARIPNQGWIIGRVTMAEFCNPQPRRKRKGPFNIPKTDYVAPHKQKTYAVGLDPSGKLHWKVGNVDTEHVIMAVTEKVSGDYLDHLRKAGVSYIVAGKSSLDFKKLAQKLYTLFGIERITVQGGGTNNGSWLEAGLIDEVSVVIMPFADTRPGTESVFDMRYAGGRKKAHTLKLISHKRYKANYVWLRYKVMD